MTYRDNWLDDAIAVAIADVARALGLDVVGNSPSFGPCPACNERFRNGPGRSHDRRGRCRIWPAENQWFCATNGTDGCTARGNGPMLAAWHLTGKSWQKGDGDTARQVRAWFAAQGWCAPETGGNGWTPPGLRPGSRPVAQAPEPRPPLAELLEFWARCVPVTEDLEVAAWLTCHPDGLIDPVAVASHDLARALPADLVGLPAWARFNGKFWTASGHRLVVLAWESDPDNPGRLRMASLHARNVALFCAPGEKAAWPRGGGARALVWATGPDLTSHGLPLVELAEGVPDWLRLVLARAELPEGGRPAVLGVVSGSADPRLAATIPRGWTVAIRTHADTKGDEYAARWAELLSSRGCPLRRQRKANGDHAAAA